MGGEVQLTTRRDLLAQMRGAGVLAAAGGSVWTAPAWGQGAPGVPPAAAFAASTVHSMSLSPDGTQLAWLDPVEDRIQIAVVPVAGGTSKLFPVGTNVKARGLWWLFDDLLALEVSVTRQLNARGDRGEYWRTLTINVATGEVSAVSPGGEAAFGSVVEIVGRGPRGTGTVYTMALTYDESRAMARDSRINVDGEQPVRRVIHLWRPGTRSYREVTRVELATRALVFDAEGQLRARLDVMLDRETTELRRFENGTWPLVTTFSGFGSPIGLEGMHDANRVLITDLRPEFGAVSALDLQTGAVEEIYAGTDRHLAGVAQDRHSGLPARIVHDTLVPSRVWLIPALQTVQNRLNRAFAGKYVTLQSWDRTYGKVLAMVDDPAGFPEYYLYDAQTRQASPVGAVPAGLAGHSFGRRTVETYEARDGLTISAIITTPAGGEGRRLPVVLLPHGGPNAQDSPGYDDTAQFLASRGYLVLQPQFRGSTGFGPDFVNAGLGEWGRAMQDDLVDCLQWAIQAGRADPARAAIMGFSYGGYAALFGATATPELFRCAISISGLSDLRVFLGWVRSARGGDAAAFWELNIDLTRFERSELEAISPRTRVTDRTCPILLVHGRDDTVVPFNQSTLMRTALREADRPHEFLELLGEDHWMSMPATRRLLYEAVERYLAAHLA